MATSSSRRMRVVGRPRKTRKHEDHETHETHETHEKNNGLLSCVPCVSCFSWQGARTLTYRDRGGNGRLRPDAARRVPARRFTMHARHLPLTTLLAAGFLASVVLGGCSSAASGTASATMEQEKGGQEEFGPYEPVANWPQPLP